MAKKRKMTAKTANESAEKSEKSEKSGFTFRAVIVAIAITLFLTASSSYIAIKLGALPWPTLFGVIVAAGLLKLFTLKKEVNIHEINVAQAGASVGGLVAAGLVFTLPGLLFLAKTKGIAIVWPNPWLIALLTVVAGVLGVLLSVPLKKTFVDEEKLPYPSGAAGAELLKLGKAGGKMLFIVMLIGAIAGIFSLIRDISFPAGFAVTSLASLGIFLTIYPSPLAAGLGYILGGRPSFSWLIGAVLGWVIIVPLLIFKGSTSGDATSLIQNLGMGLVLGSGLGFFIAYVLPRFKKIFMPIFQGKEFYFRILPWFSILGILALMFAGVHWLAAIIAMIGVWIFVAVAARMTGETNIDPLEQFGIFVGLVVALMFSLLSLNLSLLSSFLIVMFVSVACAVAGDIGHDFKSAKIIGTKYQDIIKVGVIAAIFAGIAAPFVLELIRKGFADQLFTAMMPAPQAQLVAGSIFGFAHPYIFIAGMCIAFVYEIINAFFITEKYKNMLLIMPLGIGLFLGLGIAIPLAVGALIRFIIDKKYKNLYYAGLLIAAGIMGGEGIAGFGAGALSTLGLTYAVGGYWIMAALGLVSLLSVFYLVSSKN